MKTIIKNGEYLRVTDEVGEQQVKIGAKFVSKSEWKINVRDVKPTEQAIEEIKGEKTKSKKAEKHLKLKEKQR